ncbi:MAG TPA: acetyl-CoA acetyltransferase, partial [Kofleriaceae bacterium]|nr:acetyl-CoA acetyltransferase [Kofleriaceae bacterium]
MTEPVYILGGYQTDFARNWTKEGKHISALIREAVAGGLAETRLEPGEIEVGHVGNFAAELYAMQGHLGAFLVDVDPAFSGLPTARHEAACASGSIALLAASAEIEAGRYGCAMVVGVEQMKTVNPAIGGDYLGTAAWYELEAKGVEFPFPKLFGKLGDEYDKRYGLKDEHLAHISAVNYANAKRNPKAQTRTWYMSEAHACTESKYNGVIGGRIKISDCSQVTDGAVAVFLASAAFAADYARRRGVALESLPRILGWGHRTAPISFEDKVAESAGGEYVLPHTRRAITDALGRAGLADVWQLQGIETHDCFTTSEYMAIDHFGLTRPGESWKAIEEGVIDFDGTLPINPSGGLIGA